MNNTGGNSINPLIREKDVRIEKLTKTVELLMQEKVKREFLSGFMNLLSKRYEYTEFLQHVLAYLRTSFKASYAAVFHYDTDLFHFTYFAGIGYKKDLIPESIDESGSVMGETIHNEEMVLVEDLKSRYFFVPLHQSPPEYNLVCVPIKTGKRTFVLRIANIPDKQLFAALSQALEEMAPAIAQQLDHIQQNSINEQALQGVQVSFNISRLLLKTLVPKEIVHNAFEQITNVFKEAVHMVAVRDEGKLNITEKSHEDFYLGGSPKAHMVYLRNLLESFPRGDGFIQNIHKTPRWSWPDMKYCSINLSPIKSGDHLLGTIISISKGEPFSKMAKVLLDLTANQTSSTIERATYFRKQEEFASRDGLTKLLNRRVFDAVLSAETAVAFRYKRSLSIIMFDIDHFKTFNDVHGHSTGDEVLQVVASVITKTIRTSDRAFRYGGEEFIIMCPETIGNNAALLAERLRKNVESTRTSGNLQVTISLGVTEYKSGETPDEFAKRVDDLLYQSKEGGRNQVTLG